MPETKEQATPDEVIKARKNTFRAIMLGAEAKLALEIARSTPGTEVFPYATAWHRAEAAATAAVGAEIEAIKTWIAQLKP